MTAPPNRTDTAEIAEPLNPINARHSLLNRAIGRGIMCLVGVSCAAHLIPATAATISWTNMSGGNWSTAANWSPNQVPGPADSALITSNGSYTVALDVSATIASLTLGGVSGNQTLTNSGNALALVNASTVGTNGVFGLSGGTLNGGGILAVAGLFEWTGGTLSGSVTIASSSTLAISGAGLKVLDSATLTNAGTITWTGMGDLYLNDSAQIYSLTGATFDIQNDQRITCGACSGTEAFNNAGMFRKSMGTGTNNVNVIFNNTGTVDVEMGVVSLNGRGTSSGGGTSSGTFTVAASATILLPTSYTFSSGSQVNGNGTHLWDGTITVDTTVSAANVQLAGATISGTNAFTGIVTWTSGTIGGSVTIANSSTLAISGAGLKVLDSATLTNAGTITWTGMGDLYLNDSAQIYSLTGATFDIQNDQRITCGACSGTEAFNNAGMFRKSMGTGTNNVNVIFNNTGTVDAHSGTVGFSGASFSNVVGGVIQGYGTVSVSGTTFINQGVINPGGSVGTLTIMGNLPQTSASVINIEIGGTAATNYDLLAVSGTAQLDGTLNVQLTNSFTPTSGDVFTILTCATCSGTFSANNAGAVGLTLIYTPTNVVLVSSNALPSVILTGPATQLVCAPFMLVATASDLDDAITNVDLLLGTTVLASFTNPPYQLTLSYDFRGSNTFSARAFDARGGTRTTNLNTFFYTLPTNMLSLGGIQSNGGFKLCMLGETGRNYAVLANTNLHTANWISNGVMEATNGIWRFTDLTATNFPMRYYRARQLP